jgi:hypothetical protein
MGVATTGSGGPEARHHAAQALRPIAGTELLAVGGKPKNKELAGHRLEQRYVEEPQVLYLIEDLSAEVPEGG